MSKTKVVGLIMGVLFLVFALNMISLTSLQPEYGEKITEKKPTFHWKGKAFQLWIDDNQEFTSPKITEVKNSPYTLEEELEFGTWWWKVKGVRESRPTSFMIESLVSISLKKSEEESNITNTGNTKVEVEVSEQQKGLWTVTGNVVLEEGESFTKKLKWLTLFTAKER